MRRFVSVTAMRRLRSPRNQPRNRTPVKTSPLQSGRPSPIGLARKSRIARRRTVRRTFGPRPAKGRLRTRFLRRDSDAWYGESSAGRRRRRRAKRSQAAPNTRAGPKGELGVVAPAQTGRLREQMGGDAQRRRERAKQQAGQDGPAANAHASAFDFALSVRDRIRPGAKHPCL